MATQEQIVLLRSLTNQPVNQEPWDDATMAAHIDANPTINAAAASVWEAKAASVAHLVNISEGGSSRSAGDMYEQFLKMAVVYRNKDVVAVAVRRAPMTREIVRG